MEALELLRKATVRITARWLGQDPNNPHVWVAQKKASHHAGDHVTLPFDHTNWQPLQNDARQFFFMPGYDDPNDTVSHPLR